MSVSKLHTRVESLFSTWVCALLPPEAHGALCQGWRVAIVSTFPPKKCGLATFTASLLGALRSSSTHSRGTTFGVIALSDPRDGNLYEDPAVDYELRMDRHMPSPAMLQAVHFIHKAGYSHVIIQQVSKTHPHADIIYCLRWPFESPL